MTNWAVEGQVKFSRSQCVAAAFLNLIKKPSTPQLLCVLCVHVHMTASGMTKAPASSGIDHSVCYVSKKCSAAHFKYRAWLRSIKSLINSIWSVRETRCKGLPHMSVSFTWKYPNPSEQIKAPAPIWWHQGNHPMLHAYLSQNRKKMAMKWWTFLWVGFLYLATMIVWYGCFKCFYLSSSIYFHFSFQLWRGTVYVGGFLLSIPLVLICCLM